jgi:hypothetical protein
MQVHRKRFALLAALLSVSPASALSATNASALADPDLPLAFAPGALVLREGQSIANRSLQLIMQSDGNLVLYDAAGRLLWASNTYHRCTHCLATYQNDGNLVVYDVDTDAALFASGYGSRSLTLSVNDPHLIFSPSAAQTDAMTFTPGTLSLREGQRVTSRALEFVMQTDGNLVLYDAAGNALWSSGTYHRCARCWATYQTDGNLVIYDVDTGAALFASGFGSIALTLSTHAPHLAQALPGGATPGRIWNVNLKQADHPFKGIGWNINASFPFSPAMLRLLDDTTLQFIRIVGWTIDFYQPQPNTTFYEGNPIRPFYQLLQHAKDHDISVMLTNWNAGGVYNPYDGCGAQHPCWPDSPFWMAHISAQDPDDAQNRFCHKNYTSGPGICSPADKSAKIEVTGVESDHPVSADIFANTLVNHLSYMISTKGYPIDFLTLWNEPNGDWSYHPRDASKSYPTSFDELYQSVDAALGAAGLKGKIRLAALDEGFNPTDNIDYAATHWGHLVDAYSLHEYGMPLGPSGTVSELRARANSKPIVVAEIGGGCSSNPSTSTDRWANSIETARRMSSDIRYGAYAVARWWYNGADPATNCWTATSGDAPVPENYNAIKIYANTLPQVSEDLSVLSSDFDFSSEGADVEAVAINAAPAGQPPKLVLWFVNKAAAARQMQVWIQGLPSEAIALQTQILQGVAPYSITTGPAVSLSASSPIFSITLPPASIVAAAPCRAGPT